MHSSAARGILDRVASAGVQQAVEAAARPLGEVAAVDQDDVESAQCRVPGHAGPGGAAADDQDFGAEGNHLISLPLPGSWCQDVGGGPQAAPSSARPRPLDHSNQSKVRVTAFFQYL